jgi:UPF0716 protein FxsA
MFLRLLLLFIIVPLLELVLLVKLGSVIGVGPTILIVISTGALGAWLARRQGLGVLNRISDDFSAGRLPADALIEGLLILIAGALLLTPGLITDTVGFLLLVPRVRGVLRKAVTERLARRIGDRQPPVIDAQWRRDD